MGKDYSSIIISIFKRKGAEGKYTKIVDSDNQTRNLNSMSILGENENALIFYFKDDNNWLLLSNKRVLSNKSGSLYSILNENIIEVTPAMQEEFKDGVRSKLDFTRLKLKDNSSKEYLLFLEKGQPYEGLYQALHFIATKNK